MFTREFIESYYNVDLNKPSDVEFALRSIMAEMDDLMEQYPNSADLPPELEMRFCILLNMYCELKEMLLGK